MNTTIISGRLVRNPGYNEVENEKGLHKIAKFVLAVRRNYSDEVSFIPVKAFAKKAEFGERAEVVRNGGVDAAVDNMLKITNDGRKLALDQRLVNELLPDNPESKISVCAEKSYEIWKDTAAQKSAQLIFCDLSTPKGDGSFNVYDDLKRKLMEKGVPEKEIAFIHDANTEAKKTELFGKVKSGQVRFLIGSTAKMGAGTNVQDRLIALHHLDIGWKPSDVGRILRTFKIKKNVEVTDNGKIII